MRQQIVNILSSIWFYFFNKNYRILRKSVLFDPEFYLQTNPDVLETGVDPLLHYVSRGCHELRQPGLLFDIRYYVEQVPELKGKKWDPLVHFLCEGWRSHKKAICYFDPIFYVKQNPEVDLSQTNPYLHYLQHGRNAVASIYFDSIYYTKKYSDAAEGNEHPLHHYLRVGVEEKKQPSPYFDVAYYVDNTPGLDLLQLDPLSHYFSFGIREGKSPNPLFDPHYYAQTYIIEGKGDLFARYLEDGLPAGHRPCRWFDPEFYCQHYLPSRAHLAGSLKHYLEKGVWEGLYPNREVADLPLKPVISLLVPVYNVSSAHLNNCIRSILYQSYPHWELCLADDCSTREEVRPLLEQWAARDSRIVVTFLKENQGISGATNAAAALATGTYLGFLDNDDELTNDCLFKVLQKINSEEADLYYSDEDLIGEDGTQFSVFSKPDFNKELLLSHNYVTHFVVSAKNLYDRVGGFDRAFDGAQDFDLFLKLSEQARKIIHIPEILYHWRATESSTSINHEQKQYADEAGRRAVEGALVRRGIGGKVLLTDWKFFYRVQKELVDFPLVSIILFYRVGDAFEQWFHKLLSCTNYSNSEFVVIVESEQQVLLLNPLEEEFNRKISFLVKSFEGTPAACYNAAVRKSSGQYSVFLNSWVQMQTSDWVEVLLGHAMEANSGVVGGRILPFQGDDFISTVPDLRMQSDVYYARFLQRCSQHMNGLQCAQNVLSLSWDLAMVKRECFLDQNGFAEESLGQLFADSDLCLRLWASGYENVYTPFALGQWLRPEEKQVSISSLLTRAEKTFFQKKWQEVLRTGDPYYNYGVLAKSGISQDDFLKWYAGDVI